MLTSSGLWHSGRRLPFLFFGAARRGAYGPASPLQSVRDFQKGRSRIERPDVKDDRLAINDLFSCRGKIGTGHLSSPSWLTGQSVVNRIALDSRLNNYSANQVGYPSNNPILVYSEHLIPLLKESWQAHFSKAEKEIRSAGRLIPFRHKRGQIV